MAALAAAVRPFAGGVPHRAAPAPFVARKPASGKKRPRVGVARAGDSSACLTKMASNRNSVVTATGEMSSQGLLQKRLASELDASNANQRAKPTEEYSNAPSVKRRKISTPAEQEQILAPPRMSPEESKDDEVAEEIKNDKLAEEGKGKRVEEEYADISGGLCCSCIIETGSKPSSGSSGGSDTKAKKIQDAQQRAAPKAVDMRSLLYRANLRRQLLEMKRAVRPDQSIHPRDLQRMRQLRLLLVDA